MAYAGEDFIREYPEFVDVPEAAVAAMLAESEQLLSRNVWGRWWGLARSLRTAHYLALEYDMTARCAAIGKRNPYASGSASSMSASASSLSVSYSVPSMLSGNDAIQGDLARTSYGMRFLNLLETVVTPGCVVLSPDASGR